MEPAEIGSANDGLGGFAERMLGIIDEGRRATYKPAVLLAHIDCCAEGATDDGQAHGVIATRTIARRVAELYGPSSARFPDRLGQPTCDKSPTVPTDGFAGPPEGRCFYCLQPLLSSTAVDHFMPWSRWPNDAVENVVLAHPTCNSHKSDRIPGTVPLDRWAVRLHSQSDRLLEIAEEARWRSDKDRTLSLVRSLYTHLLDGAPVWNAPQQLGVARRDKMLSLQSFA